MSKLYLFAVFHANLNFSFISPRFYPVIIERCYKPLLDILERTGIPLGLEFSAYTLEVIQRLDSKLVERLRRLWEEGACEIIGSGYVQSIFPLIPARVNLKNLNHGNLVYQSLLGRRPETAFINEQVFSRGLPELYRQAGYRTVIANWESASGGVPGGHRYRPCAAEAGENEKINLIWNSLNAYRNFQNYTEDKMDSGDFWRSIMEHRSASENRLYPLYGSDWEVFDFKPWQSEPLKDAGGVQMEKIENLLKKLVSEPGIEIIPPGRALELFKDRPVAVPSSASWPLPFKKQDFFSVTRWAVGGRDAVRFNTLCYRLYELLLSIESAVKEKESEEANALWQELIFLWNSDFRTFTTEEKFLEFYCRMGDALGRAERQWARLKRRTDASAVELSEVSSAASCPPAVRGEAETAVLPARYRTVAAGVLVKTASALVRLEPDKGGTLGSVVFPSISKEPLLLSAARPMDSGWLLGGIYLKDRTGRTFTDCHETKIVSVPLRENGGEWAEAGYRLQNGMGTLAKTYRVYAGEPRVDIFYRFQLGDFVPHVFRLGRMMLNPDAFDSESLYYQTVNGGLRPEQFLLKGRSVAQDEILNAEVSAKGCLGATEGWVVLGDKNIRLKFSSPLADLYSVPLVHYKETPDSWFCSLVYSMGEQDDSTHALWRGSFSWSLSITASRVL